jgi:putative oxidoreductase
MNTCGCLKCETGWKTYAVVLGRVLLGLVFLIAGWNKLTGFGGTVGYITSAGLPMPEVLAVLAIIFEFGGAVMLILGIYTRLAAAALVVFTALATLIYHTNIADPMQQSALLKNLAIIGGLLMVKVYGGGPWRLPFPKEESCACCKDCKCDTCKV